MTWHSSELSAFAPSDKHHLEAAEGWLLLGDLEEAKKELAQVSPNLQKHPTVLRVRWHVHAKLNDWETCISLSQQLTELVPHSASSWIDFANSLFFAKRVQEAYDILLPMLPKFNSNWPMRYNLACYACQLARLDEAWEWLGKALTLGHAKKVKKTALADPDLLPLRPKMHESWGNE